METNRKPGDILWIIDPHDGINRHFDIDNRVHTRPLTAPPDRVLKGHTRKVDLRALVTEIVLPRISPERLIALQGSGGFPHYALLYRKMRVCGCRWAGKRIGKLKPGCAYGQSIFLSFRTFYLRFS
jgi:hypothetical protein